jgi:hypothetical protein
MLTELSIKNFKAWKDTGKVRLAPITVFFGSNSAGKTSLLQFLLMLRQTAESPDRHRVLHPGDRNTPVELGTFRDLVFEHNLSNEIEFTLAWDLPKTMVVTDPLAVETLTGTRISFSANIASDPKGAQQRVRRFQYLLANGRTSLAVEMKPLEGGASKYELSASHYKLVRNLSPMRSGLTIKTQGSQVTLHSNWKSNSRDSSTSVPFAYIQSDLTFGRGRFQNTLAGEGRELSRLC